MNGHGHGEGHRSFGDNESQLEKFLTEDLVILDYGCGVGRYCKLLARYARKLYCVDVDGASVIEAGKTAPGAITAMDTKGIVDRSVDFILLANSFHDMQDKKGAVAEIDRILKKDGKIAIVDWVKKPTEFGPPQAIRMDANDYIREFRSYRITDTFEPGIWHYGIIIQRT